MWVRVIVPLIDTLHFFSNVFSGQLPGACTWVPALDILRLLLAAKNVAGLASLRPSNG